MSVEAQELMSNEWTRWQGYLVNGVYPLGRPLGSAAQSGVFETRAEAPGQLAIKLIPASQGQAQLQLPRWALAGKLSHPHVLSLRESGSCELEGLPYLYVVMEYADQTLAQLLLRRALTAEEAREMLLPMLDALTFLHDQDLVQGDLKPANVLVVGDQLKLASDKIRHTDDSTPSPWAPSVYAPPEGGTSAAGDMWALGLSLSEALTRRSPSPQVGHRSSITLPADFSPEFRELVAACLRHKPQDRPHVRDVVAWMGGQPLKPIPDTVNQPAAWERPQALTVKAAAPVAVASEVSVEVAQPPRPVASFTKPVPWLTVTLSAAVILALSWTGVRWVHSHRTPDAQIAPVDVASQAATVAAMAQDRAAVSATSTTSPAPSDATEHFALHEELPVVPRSAARTLHGHVKVSVQAAVNPDGSVSRVVVDRSGRSRYLQKLAGQAAKKWTFSPVQPGPARQVLIQFDFSRDQTTAHAIPIH